MNLQIKSKAAVLSGCISLALSCVFFSTTTSANQTALPEQAIDHLPEGRLKQSLAKLPPQAQQKVLGQLALLGIPAIDTLLIEADDSGELFYVEEGLIAEAATEDEARTLPPVDVFKLHSKPNAINKVFLDFDGGAISGRAWGGGASYDTVPYDIDGDPSTFNDTERARIHDIWNRMADDFAAFDIDVTTEAPSEFGPNIGWVLFTKDSDSQGTALPAQGAGGVAYVGVWGRSNFTYYQPALVYYNRLGNGVASYMAEAGSHELGHNLGLSHDGTSTTNYYAGLGSDSEPSSWAPIMGVGYYKNITQWSKGEYPDANQQQDDIAIIADKLGLTFDTEGQQSTPTQLYTNSTGQFSATNRESDPNNVITDNKGTVGINDSDWFEFNAGSGPAEFNAIPAWDAFTRTSRRGANLDIGMRLYDSSGQLLATSSNNSDSSASLQVTLAQGIHLLEVFGDAGPYANDYASQGHFYLNGSITPTTPDITPPDPNPMSFAQVPRALNDTQIEMQANIAVDDSGGTVSYLFTCTQDTGTCDSSDWQTSPMYTTTGLTSATEYCFSVQARDLSANITLASAQHCATTHAAQPQPEPPTAPSNLTVMDGQNGTAILSWQDNSNNEQSFEVQRESMHKSGRWRDTQAVATLDADINNFVDNSGTGTFRYRVQATNHAGVSPWSAWLEVVVSDSNAEPDKPCKGKKCSN